MSVQTNKTINNMKQREKLTRYAINRLKGLMAKEIKLIRVYPYESHSNDVLAATDYSSVRIQKDSLLYKRLLDIRRIAENLNMSDNKIVIQVEVDCGGHRNFLFLGYWDSNYSIGTSVRPCLYAPKEFPCNN
jgi:hypothetical protein